ncbi:hypothetical protein BJD12_11210 [Xanthomonas vesicatoria ATCC 35937]|uniref:Uncharacterized protein n=2 Tax=Xanthomonas vesicatoria TaxID=56460 RepID=A0AAJ0N2X4_9XANT|nr:hypothetical protein BI313_14195 [Xanthomonas vesicatoria]APP75718.1 hypothetical protein BJD12_11210 [Xanthomonas vesicatoria ATCC 35937]KHM91103.1 hypothetical protein OR60_20325 [Xanthomonas vesicatoria]KHM91272.1 hypothetical protein OR61_19480 [Xanthomonas vesicatoria]KTF29667.1 hypothetical protein LMG920_21760 [Xanthomonas vesicatoria]
MLAIVHVGSGATGIYDASVPVAGNAQPHAHGLKHQLEILRASPPLRLNLRSVQLSWQRNAAVFLPTDIHVRPS